MSTAADVHLSESPSAEKVVRAVDLPGGVALELDPETRNPPS